MGEPSEQQPQDLPANICDICTDKGRCCKNFVVPQPFFADEGDEAVLEYMREKGLPFVPTEVAMRITDMSELFGRTIVLRKFKCSALDPDTGRCDIYETRPKACRNYKPGQDGMCVYGSGTIFDKVIEERREAEAAQAEKTASEKPAGVAS
jgi:Fe-S-cluster containining protein